MKNLFLFLFVSLVGFSFVGVGDVYADYFEGELKWQSRPPNQCQTQKTGETSSKSECECCILYHKTCLSGEQVPDNCTKIVQLVRKL